MKIAIFWYSGSVVSQLSEKLSNYYSIPKLHMDTLQFQLGLGKTDFANGCYPIKITFNKHIEWGSSILYSLCYFIERLCKKLTKSSLNFSPLTCLFLEPLSVILNTVEKSEKVWAKIALNALSGSLSDGFFGMGVAKLKKNYQKLFAKYSHINSLFFEMRKL